MSFYCDPCKTPFSSALSQEVHENSPIHKKKVDQLLRLQELNETLHESTTQDDGLETSDDGPQTHDPHIIEVDKNQYFCQLCKAPCSGKIPAFHHIRGQQHTKMLEQANFSPEDASLSFLAKSTLTPRDSSSIPINCGMPVSGPEIPGFEYNRLTGHHFCEVCQISVTGSAPAREHLKGGKHKKKLQITGETRHLADDLADMMEGLNLSGSRKTTTSPLDAPKSLIDGSYQQVDGTPVSEYVSPKPTTDDIANAGYLPAAVETVKLIDVPEHGTYGAVLGSEQADNTDGYNGELIQAEAHLKKKSLTGGMDAVALTVDPSPRMSPYIRPPPGSPSTRPPLGFEAVDPSQFRQENRNLLGFTDVDVQSPPGQDLLESEFTFDPRTRRFICNTCRIEVSGAENAVSHLRGANHAKVKALQFQLNRMPPPPVTAPPAGVTESQPPGHTSDRRNFAAASSYPPSPSNRLNDGPESSIEVLRQEGQNHSVSFEISPTRVSTLSALTPTRTNTAQGHTSPWYPPDPSKAAADQNDTRFIDRQSDDAGEACGSGIPPPTNPQTFPQDPLALTVDPSPRMSPSTRPPPGFETVDPSQIRQAVRVGQKDGQSQDLLKTEFQFDRRTQNFICNTCRIEVSGAENAGSHLRGANHAKKVEALHFQLNHMPPPPAISD